MSKREILPEFESLNTKHLTQNPRQRARVYVREWFKERVREGGAQAEGYMYIHMCVIHRRSLYTCMRVRDSPVGESETRMHDCASISLRVSESGVLVSE